MTAWLRRWRCLAVLALCASLGLAPTADAQNPIKRVLVIHGGTESFPSNVRFDAALRESLSSDPIVEVDYHAEFLETEAFGALADTTLRDYIATKFRGRRFDTVVANTRPALDFALRYRAELFPDVPIVFVATLPPAVLPPGVTGLVRDPSQTETLELALKLHPRTTRVHVVAHAPFLEGYEQRMAASLAPIAHGVALTYAHEATLAEAVETIRRLPADSLIFYARYSPVTTGRAVLPDEAFAQIAAAAPVPIYSSNDINFGRGVLGGMMRSEGQMATRLGEITLRILKGAKPEDIPVESAALALAFDWRQMQRWGLSPESLPPGSEIRFRVPTDWELYGTYVLGALAVVSAQLLLIAGLLHSRARLRRADDTIRAREASLRGSYERIRQIAGRLIHAQEATRAEIARDLHDDVCQRLASVSIGVGTLKNTTGSLGDPKVQDGIAALDRETRDAFESIRRLSHELHPSPLRLLGLEPALRSHCREIEKRHGVHIQFSTTDTIGSIHPDVAVCLFRIAQEALRNSIFHGGAKRMTVTLNRDGEEIDLAVADEGHGFDVAAVRNTGRGLGLVTMEERVNLVGGRTSVVSVPDQGTTVRVRSPATPHPMN
jgi:signal transduction histidine kinase